MVVVNANKYVRKKGGGGKNFLERKGWGGGKNFVGKKT